MNCGGSFDISEQEKVLANLNKKTLQEDFWSNNDKAKAVLRDINYIEKEIDSVKKINEYSEELSLHNELFSMGESISDEFIDSLNEYEQLLDNFEINT